MGVRAKLVSVDFLSKLLSVDRKLTHCNRGQCLLTENPDFSGGRTHSFKLRTSRVCVCGTARESVVSNCGGIWVWWSGTSRGRSAENMCPTVDWITWRSVSRRTHKGSGRFLHDAFFRRRDCHIVCTFFTQTQLRMSAFQHIKRRRCDSDGRNGDDDDHDSTCRLKRYSHCARCRASCSALIELSSTRT